MTLIDQLAAELSVPSETLRASLLASESAEAAVPNYLTVDPSTGRVGALFTGGLQMLENTSGNYTAGSALGWKDPTTGAVRSFLEGFVIAGNHLLHLAAQPDSNDWAYVNCEAHATGGAGSANVNVSTADNAGNTSSVKLLDSLGRSGFLQLLSTQKLRAAFGQATATFPGGQNFADVTVTTSLAAAAQVVVATCAQVFEVACVAEWRSTAAPDNNHEIIRVETRDGSNPAAATTKNVAWIALG